jgi:hypothetical protein
VAEFDAMNPTPETMEEQQKAGEKCYEYFCAMGKPSLVAPPKDKTVVGLVNLFDSDDELSYIYDDGKGDKSSKDIIMSSQPLTIAGDTVGAATVECEKLRLLRPCLVLVSRVTYKSPDL